MEPFQFPITVAELAKLLGYDPTPEQLQLLEKCNRELKGVPMASFPAIMRRKRRLFRFIGGHLHGDVETEAYEDGCKSQGYARYGHTLLHESLDLPFPEPSQ